MPESMQERDVECSKGKVLASTYRSWDGKIQIMQTRGVSLDKMLYCYHANEICSCQTASKMFVAHDVAMPKVSGTPLPWGSVVGIESGRGSLALQETARCSRVHGVLNLATMFAFPQFWKPWLTQVMALRQDGWAFECCLAVFAGRLYHSWSCLPARWPHESECWWVGHQDSKYVKILAHQRCTFDVGLAEGSCSLRKDKDLLERISGKDLPPSRPSRLWAISDIHTDKKENMQWISNLDPHECLGQIGLGPWSMIKTSRSNWGAQRFYCFVLFVRPIALPTIPSAELQLFKIFKVLY